MNRFWHNARLALTVVMLGLLAWGFRELLFTQLPYMFNDPVEDMSFAWYVPIFSLYVLWRERKEIVASFGAPAWGGLLFALPFLFVGFLGVRGTQVRFGVLAVVGLLIAIPWTLFGARTAKRVLFPALFLLFCLPLANFLDVITVHLRLLATSTAYTLLRGFGADVVRSGTAIASASGAFAVDVAAPCSGLRSIFALMALTAGYAYFYQPTWLRRGLLFSLSVPLAVLGNVMRILTICLVGTYASGEFATGFYHDYSGYVVFAAAIALMVASGEIITRVAERLHPASVRQSVAPCAAPVSRGAFAAPFVLLAALATVMALQTLQRETVLCEAPKVEFAELKGYERSPIEPSEAELNLLPSDTQIAKCRYVAADGSWFVISAVIGGRSKNSIHRPELCLPSQGFSLMSAKSATWNGEPWRYLTLAGGGMSAPVGFAYSFFNQDKYRTSSHIARIFRDVWDRSVAGRIDRWAMVTLFSSVASEECMAGFLAALKDGGMLQ